MCYIEENKSKEVDYPEIVIVSFILSLVISNTFWVFDLISSTTTKKIDLLVVFLCSYLIFCITGYLSELKRIRNIKDVDYQ